MNDPRLVAVVTGSRADFGLLRPVIDALGDQRGVEPAVVVTGVHLLPPARTVDEVAAAFPIAATVEMQQPGLTGRDADARALGRGTGGLAAAFAELSPDVVLVLGDRIEAFAAASAAAVGGIRVAHIHGGDRAAGVADDSMRHAISKLAHIHFPATARSTERLLYLGESPRRVHLAGSPAIDDLASIPALPDDPYAGLGSPDILFMLHPTGEADVVEEARAALLLDACRREGSVLALAPNRDPGCRGIDAAIEAALASDHAPDGRSLEPIRTAEHLDRHAFVGLLRRVRMLAGNSSAGRIEASAIPVRALDVGPRQSGRECPRSVLHCPTWDEIAVRSSVERAFHEPVPPFQHPYGDGHAGRRIAAVLATFDPDNHAIAKRNTY